MGERLISDPPPQTPSTARLTGAFALAHFPFSLLSLFLTLYLFPAINAEFATTWADDTLVPALVLMALYFPLGLLFGAGIPWARVHTPQELVRAISSQAMIAWGWAAAMFSTLFLGLWPGVILTFFLAFPSSLFALSFCFLFPDASLPLLLVSLMTLAIPAGLLPPLLFNLGSFCATRCRVELEISR